MKDVSDTIDGPRKRAAIGDGISAGSASPFRDSESPPPRRSKARPTSAPYGSNSEFEGRQPNTVDEKKQLWSPDHHSPIPRTSFDPKNVASIQTQKARNQVIPPKARKPFQAIPQPGVGSSRQSNPQGSPNPTPQIFGRQPTQPPQPQPKDELFDIVMQPETRPISQEQLVAEVKGSKSSKQITSAFPSRVTSHESRGHSQCFIDKVF